MDSDLLIEEFDRLFKNFLASAVEIVPRLILAVAVLLIVLLLALREFRIGDWMKVAWKEVAVGFLNGVAIALTTSLIVYFWASLFGLALVISISMILSMVVAESSGAVIPILLKSAGQDPAQSSSIVLTMVTYIVGFFSFLGLATFLGDMIGIS